MREAIGGTWLFQIVIVFILIFTGYICLSINHSKAFAVKDDIIETIERYNGIDLDSVTNAKDNLSNPCIEAITDRLKTVSYRTSGNCTKLNSGDANDSKWAGFNREGGRNDEHATYCIKEVNTSKGSSELPSIRYYKVAVFYQLDLPVFNSFLSFKVVGDTKLIYQKGLSE